MLTLANRVGVTICERGDEVGDDFDETARSKLNKALYESQTFLAWNSALKKDWS